MQKLVSPNEGDGVGILRSLAKFVLVGICGAVGSRCGLYVLKDALSDRYFSSVATTQKSAVIAFHQTARMSLHI